MARNCTNCCHFVERLDKELFDVFSIRCNLDNVLRSSSGVYALSCPNYNKDLSQEHICLNCKNFLGGSDWGLSCGKEYHRLVCSFDGTDCKEFERRIL